jgi:hypothetical protein
LNDPATAAHTAHRDMPLRTHCVMGKRLT